MKKVIIGGVFFNVVYIIIAALLLTLNKSTMIIFLGVVLANLLWIAIRIILILLFVVGNMIFVRKILKARAKPREKIVLEFTGKDAHDPEQIRQELTRYQSERPALKSELAEVYSQMDSMDRKQEKIRSIFERSKVESLSEVEATIEDAEQAMFRNAVKLINRAILWDPLEWNKPGKEAIYQGHRSYIHKLIGQNEDILSQCDILLAETVGYLDEKDSENSGKFHLDVMTKTIHSLRQINSTEL